MRLPSLSTSNEPMPTTASTVGLAHPDRTNEAQEAVSHGRIRRYEQFEFVEEEHQRHCALRSLEEEDAGLSFGQRKV